MAEGTFAEAVQASLGLIGQAIARIEQNHGEPDELSTMRAYLVELLRLTERSPGIDAAADDLDATATGLVRTTAADGAPALARLSGSCGKPFSASRSGLPMPSLAQRLGRWGVT